MDPLVSVDWLAAHLHDPNLVLLDATLPPPGVTLVPDVAERYRERHIPGALRFDIEAHSDKGTSLPHMLPTPELFAEQMSALGVSSDAILVVYEQGTLFAAARAWWMLRTMGVPQVFVLEGGLPAWERAGQPVSSEPVQRRPAVFTPHFHPEAVQDLAGVRSLLGSHAPGSAQIVDARSAGRFAGTAPEPRPGLSSGHMPGSVNLPYTELVTPEGGLRDKESLTALFQAKGLDLQRPITTTCGSGVTAAVLALGLARAGARIVQLYDGSWAEYASQHDAEIRKDDPESR